VKELGGRGRAESRHQPRHNHEADEKDTSVLDFHHDDLPRYPTSYSIQLARDKVL
jgi:hypothetical protein